MGCDLRKSISVGPLRFSLSKSGIGVSSGARDLRLGKKFFAFGLLLLLLLPSLAAAIIYQVLPANMPAGLHKQISGKYRIIEHDRSQKLWFVYDVQKWKKYTDNDFSEEYIEMYPPIHQYISGSDGWYHTVINKPMQNMYMMGLVTIIEKGKSMKHGTPEGKQLSAQQAKAVVMKAFYSDNKRLWSFKSRPYKNGVLVCAFSQNLPDSIAIWWAKGDKVYNVNGIARSKTKKFELTFDPDISGLDAFAQCKSYR
jgi:hypothetical protein